MLLGKSAASTLRNMLRNIFFIQKNLKHLDKERYEPVKGSLKLVKDY